MAETIGDLVRRLREQRNWTSYELAERSGLNRSIVSKLERGLRTATPETLAKLADALDVGVEDLYAAAGFAAPKALPSFQPYLRAKYAHLPADKVAVLTAYFEEIEREFRRDERTDNEHHKKGGRS
jgi:transcriptional regulator with XRE-family HTH domain